MPDEIRQLTAQLTYQSNCHYNESKWESSITIPKQETIIDIIDISNIDAENRINETYQHNNIHYLNDRIQITAQVINAHTNELITYGKVDFYFKEENKAAKKITPYGIDLSIDGLAQIIHQPHNNGYYYAQYIGDEDNEYYLTSTSDNASISFDTIPVMMDFHIDKNFINPEESVVLTAHVTDVYGNDINYGTVTFYTERTNNINNPNDGFERIIGDPVVVQNGIAEIEYSPIQNANNQLSFYYNNVTGNLIYSYDDNKEFRTIYITADNKDDYPNTEIGDMIYIVNDENDEIDVENDILYFKHDDIYNNIINNIEYIYAHFNYKNENYAQNFKYYTPHRCKALLSILNPDTANIGIGINDNNTFKNIYDTYDKYDGFLHVSCEDSLILQATITNAYNDIITNFTEEDTITFHINGTSEHQIRNGVAIDNYTFSDSHYEVIGRYNHDIFECIMDTPLEPGYYTIQGVFDGNNQYMPTKTVTLYLCVEKSQYNVNITCTLKNTFNNENINKGTVVGNIQQDAIKPLNNDIWKKIFTNQICYLYFNDIRYQCSIQYDTTLQYYTIITKENIIFNTPNNYYVKIMLPSLTYQNLILPTINSNSILVSVRKLLIPYIKSLSIEKKVYPGAIKGILSVKNIYDEKPTITITIDNDGQKTSKNYIYDNDDIIFSFDNIDASINEHVIYATINNQKSDEQTFIIQRANLTTYLDMYYKTATCNSKNKSSLITGINKNINFIVDSDGSDFTNYNIDNININLSACNDDNYQHPTPQVEKINNNKQLRVSYQQTLSLPQDWQTGIVFNGDNNYNGPSIQYYSFKTYTIKPIISYNRDDDNKELQISITDNNGNSISQYILIEIEIQDMNGDSHYNNIITDTNGYAILNCNNVNFESNTQWQNIQKIIFTTNPFNQTTINDIKNASNKVQAFIECYPNLQCGTTKTTDNIFINGIINQLIANDYKCFYTTYSDIIDIQNFQMEPDTEIPVTNTYPDE